MYVSPYQSDKVGDSLEKNLAFARTRVLDNLKYVTVTKRLNDSVWIQESPKWPRHRRPWPSDVKATVSLVGRASSPYSGKQRADSWYQVLKTQGEGGLFSRMGDIQTSLHHLLLKAVTKAVSSASVWRVIWVETGTQSLFVCVHFAFCRGSRSWRGPCRARRCLIVEWGQLEHAHIAGIHIRTLNHKGLLIPLVLRSSTLFMISRSFAAFHLSLVQLAWLPVSILQLNSRITLDK